MVVLRVGELLGAGEEDEAVALCPPEDTYYRIHIHFSGENERMRESEAV